MKVADIVGARLASRKRLATESARAFYLSHYSWKRLCPSLSFLTLHTANLRAPTNHQQRKHPATSSISKLRDSTHSITDSKVGDRRIFSTPYYTIPTQRGHPVYPPDIPGPSAGFMYPSHANALADQSAPHVQQQAFRRLRRPRSSEQERNNG